MYCEVTCCAKLCGQGIFGSRFGTSAVYVLFQLDRRQAAVCHVALHLRSECEVHIKHTRALQQHTLYVSAHCVEKGA